MERDGGAVGNLCIKSYISRLRRHLGQYNWSIQGIWNLLLRICHYDNSNPLHKALASELSWFSPEILRPPTTHRWCHNNGGTSVIKKRILNNLILQAVYDIVVQSENDSYIDVAERAMGTVATALMPGRYLVDTFPICELFLYTLYYSTHPPSA
jgi:hypothetical protein